MQIDIKNTKLRICDGRKASFTTTSVAADSELVFTESMNNRGFLYSLDPVTVTFIRSGLSTLLSVSVTGKAISVHLATDGGGVATSTAAQIKTLLDGTPTVTALVSTAFQGTVGAGVADPFGFTPLINGARNILIKVAEGNLTWDETANRRYQSDRGLLDAVINGDQDPMDLKFSLAWEFLQAVTGSGSPTVEDALLQRGEASTWVTTSSDACEPYQVDIQLEHDPPCAGVPKEIVTFKLFVGETFDHDPKQSMIAVAGKCNCVMPDVQRV